MLRTIAALLAVAASTADGASAEARGIILRLRESDALREAVCADLGCGPRGGSGELPASSAWPRRLAGDDGNATDGSGSGGSGSDGSGSGETCGSDRHSIFALTCRPGQENDPSHPCAYYDRTTLGIVIAILMGFTMVVERALAALEAATAQREVSKARA